MEKEPRLVVEDNSQSNALSTLGEQLARFHRFAGCADYRQLFAFLWGDSDELIGGMIAATHSSWLYVEFVWVSEAFRRRGYGARLLAAAEQEAKNRDCRAAYLDTGGANVLSFFQKHGYMVCGEMLDYLPGQPRFWLRKSLT